MSQFTQPQLEEFKASGLRDETILENGVRCETDPAVVHRLLNRQGKRGRPKLGACIVYPFTTLDDTNGYCQIKPARPDVDKKSGKPKKYECPVGKPPEVYFPKKTREAIRAGCKKIIITEGPKKALAADQDGFPCIGLIGVDVFTPKGRFSLHNQLAAIDWKGVDVFIAYDSDLESNERVRDAEARLSHLLKEAGGVVKCLRIPNGPNDDEGKPTKQGLDDFIVAKGANALYDLMEHAVDAPELTAAEVKSSANELDPAGEVQAFLEADKADGVYRLRFWRGSFWRCRTGCYQELQQSEIRAKLVNRLNQTYFKLTTGAVNNCLDQLRAQTLLESHTEPPSWLGDKAEPFPASETLVCKNGLLHLPGYLDQTPRHFRTLTPRFFSTCGLDFDFDPDAQQPVEWLKFLNTLWPDDPDSIDMLREWFGYSLLPNTSQHKILLLVGPPRSGKGTIARVLSHLIGKANVCGPTLASLGSNFGLWPLVGKSLAIVSDARLGGRADLPTIVERLLSISGEDGITIDRKLMEPLTCTLSTRFVVLSNELPRLSDSSGALANRMIILRLTESFLGCEDKGLMQRLLPELPSILLWAIVGWDRLRRRGYFEEPQATADMRSEFDDLTSPIGAFLREHCVVGQEYNAVATDLYAEYREWCGQIGRQHVEDSAGFGRSLRAAAPRIRRVQRRIDGKREWCYEGVGLLAVTSCH